MIKDLGGPAAIYVAKQFSESPYAVDLPTTFVISIYLDLVV